MSSTSAIAISGVSAAQASLQVSANNIANANTPEFRRQRVEQSAGASGGVATTTSLGPETATATQTETESVDVEVADVVGLLQAKNALLANLSVFRTADRMAGALLDAAG